MENSLHIAEPVALVRPRGAHRFEGFSPKLARRLTFYRRGLLEQWLLLEADPMVIVFCERPGYVIVNGRERLADFWVRYVDRQELVILDDTFDENHATKSHRHLDEAGLPIRKVLSADLAAARVWIDIALPCPPLAPVVRPSPISTIVAADYRLFIDCVKARRGFWNEAGTITSTDRPHRVVVTNLVVRAKSIDWSTNVGKRRV
jgi:hypothetical protein